MHCKKKKKAKVKETSGGDEPNQTAFAQKGKTRKTGTGGNPHSHIRERQTCEEGNILGLRDCPEEKQSKSQDSAQGKVGVGKSGLGDQELGRGRGCKRRGSWETRVGGEARPQGVVLVDEKKLGPMSCRRTVTT